MGYISQVEESLILCYGKNLTLKEKKKKMVLGDLEKKYINTSLKMLQCITCVYIVVVFINIQRVRRYHMPIVNSSILLSIRKKATTVFDIGMLRNRFHKQFDFEEGYCSSR